MRKGLIAALAAAVLVAIAVPLAGSGLATTVKAAKPDTYEPSGDVHAKLNRHTAHFRHVNVANASKVGVVKTWVGLDDVEGSYYTKDYRLRAKGKHIEVWVTTGTRTAFGQTGTDTNFQDGDCRNGERTLITDDQVAHLIDAFDNTIYPIESGKKEGVFSKPPGRDGKHSQLAPAFGLPHRYYSGDKDDIVVLIDNVRDDNWYDVNNTQGLSYIAGFFSSQLNGFFDRNVMTIDAFDWNHRTGENPPNDPVPGDNCASAPARPNLYEGVFAHEYQHLLLSYVDGAESTWQNEGTSDTAIVLTGYGDPKAGVDDVHFDSHIQCFQGFNGVQTDANPNPRPGGPENSLNQWGDQDFDHEQEILCDYGAAYSFLLWLAGQYGDQILTDLHRDADHQGFDAVQVALDDRGAGITVSQAIDRWLAGMALDKVIDDGATLTGGDPGVYQTDRLGAHINWDTDDAYDTPGGPPNGGDFVRLRDGGGSYLPASGITSIGFNGVSVLPTQAPTWVVDNAPPPGASGAALYSTNADNRNDVIVQNVSVPSGSPSLTFDAAWDLETTFDFGYVQITTDNGESYTSLQCTDTQDDGEGDNVGPGFGQGFNGFDGSGGQFRPQTCDLTPYAGQTVGLAFRYYSDSNTHGDGFWVDDVAIDGTTISDGSSLAGWLSQTQYNPIEVEGWTVQLISYDSAGSTAHVASIPLDGNFDGSLSGTDLAGALDPGADVVSAIVTYHDGTELVQQYACYALTVNGVTQPGGC
ncbi:MAG TPA: peptidase M6 [Actinomycetota bacterium]|jgi:hypothetical protein